MYACTVLVPFKLCIYAESCSLGYVCMRSVRAFEVVHLCRIMMSKRLALACAMILIQSQLALACAMILASVEAGVEKREEYSESFGGQHPGAAYKNKVCLFVSVFVLSVINKRSMIYPPAHPSICTGAHMCIQLMCLCGGSFRQLAMRSLLFAKLRLVTAISYM